MFTGSLFVHYIPNLRTRKGSLLLQRGRLALHVLVDSGEGTFRSMSLPIRSCAVAGLSTWLRVYDVTKNIIKSVKQSQGSYCCWCRKYSRAVAPGAERPVGEDVFSLHAKDIAVIQDINFKLGFWSGVELQVRLEKCIKTLYNVFFPSLVIIAASVVVVVVVYKNNCTIMYSSLSQVCPLWTTLTWNCRRKKVQGFSQESG